MGLGPYQEVSLAEARDKARELRRQIRNGIDPLKEKHAQKAHQEKTARKQKTFHECAEAVLEIKGRELKSKSMSHSGALNWRPMFIRLLVRKEWVRLPRPICWRYWNPSG